LTGVNPGKIGSAIVVVAPLRCPGPTYQAERLGQNFEFTYAALCRPLTRTEKLSNGTADLTTTWTSRSAATLRCGEARLSASQSGMNGGAALQNDSYLFDPTGLNSVDENTDQHRVISALPTEPARRTKLNGSIRPVSLHQHNTENSEDRAVPLRPAMLGEQFISRLMIRPNPHRPRCNFPKNAADSMNTIPSGTPYPVASSHPAPARSDESVPNPTTFQPGNPGLPTYTSVPTNPFG
jgi:hypothetical protein